MASWEIPKPPAPKKPSSSALANASADVKSPPADPAPADKMMKDVEKIDIEEAGKHFDGNCLDKKQLKEIEEIGCKARFMDILQNFD